MPIYEVVPDPANADTSIWDMEPIGTLETKKEYLVVSMVKVQVFFEASCLFCRAPQRVYSKLVDYDEAVSYLSENGLNFIQTEALVVLVSQGIINLRSIPGIFWIYSGNILKIIYFSCYFHREIP